MSRRSNIDWGIHDTQDAPWLAEWDQPVRADPRMKLLPNLRLDTTDGGKGRGTVGRQRDQDEEIDLTVGGLSSVCSASSSC
jgi:hypothetical protein